jgi:hypothetical protein
MMSSELPIGSKVLLVSFNRKTAKPINANLHENFLELIGSSGVVIDNAPPKEINKNRVLVVFDVALNSMGLPCHNEIENSLWIERSDLHVIV